MISFFDHTVKLIDGRAAPYRESTSKQTAKDCDHKPILLTALTRCYI